MILTHNEEYSEKLKTFRHHGIIKEGEKLKENHGPWYYEIQELGHNFRITDIQCALGISQMERRREIAKKYDEAFKDFPEIITPTETDGAKHAYHIYVIQLSGELENYRKEIFEALRAENIGVNVHYVPVHLHPFYKREYGFEKGDFPIAEKYYNRAITLPIFPRMSDKDVRDVIRSVKKVRNYYA